MIASLYDAIIICCIGFQGFSKMFIEHLTTIDQPRLNEWFKRSLNSNIPHQLSLSNWTAEIEIKNTSWEQVVLMDTNNKAVTLAKFDRDDHTAFISHWRTNG